MKYNGALTESDHVNFPRLKYSDPEFSWKNTIGIISYLLYHLVLSMVLLINDA